MVLAARKTPGSSISKTDRSFLNRKERSKSLFFQPKLTVGPTNDVYEQEADAMADNVMRMQDDHHIQTKPVISSLQRKCAECEEEEERAQRKETGETTGETPSIVNDVVNSGGGENMDNNTRSFMESRFGYDFSQVKIHNDAVAAKSAQSINALAYTSGSNIVFNQGQYAPGTNNGKKLLAHELTHVVQQGASHQNSIQRSCDLDFSGYTGPTCEGTIHVGATTISSPIIGYYHLFVLYTDSTGTQYYMRGGPGGSDDGYGEIVTSCAPYVEGEIEYDPRNVLEEVYQGLDACNKLRIMKDKLNEIEGWHLAYVPAGPNSNSVVASLLSAAGLPHRKPAVPTPGFEMEVTSEGGREIGQDRPTALLISFGGGNGFLLNAGVRQRVYTFSPTVGGGIPLPIPLELDAGFYSFPVQGRFGGSIGLGTDISLLNLPLSSFSPLGITLGGGFTAGGIRTEDPSGARLDPEVGGYGRAGLYVDMDRLRISPQYQFNAFHNTQTEETVPLHSFMLQMGYVF